jgi:outer membrane protein OmpA-like peptidoglycan-associated protein
MFDQTTSADPTFNYAAQVGVSLMLLGGPGDKDKDGVIDSADKCPDTPKGAKVEATGCPDADGDGVADQVDRCPGTPAGRVVDAIGCTDSDGDGVVDPQDRCAGTPSGVRVDATGCPLDTDRDGVPDVSDRCANTPAGVAVDPTTGCPLDQDRDGVADPQDRCPNTPAGTSVDPATGCPVDLDGDGVADVADRCPNTPAGTAVDANGCPASAPVVLEGVTFVTGSAKLTLASQAPLDRAVAAIRGRSERFVIEGHTDNVGNRDANIRLSKARADVVRAYFVSKGIPATQMTTVGLGPDQPVASNDTPEGRAKNRRVQLRVAP